MLSREFKIVRTSKSFEGSHVLVAVFCQFSGGGLTFWSLVFLFLFQLMGLIFMCRSLYYLAVDSSKDPEDQVWGQQHVW